MRISRVKAGAAILATAALIAGHGAYAQRAGRLPVECRTPELRQCIMNGSSNRGQCLLKAMESAPENCRQLFNERASSSGGAALPTGWQESAYGSDPKQAVDWALPGAGADGKSPLIVFIHGGGWSIGDKRRGAGVKGEHFLAEDWAFASTNYRLVPNATVEQQAADVASAIALLRKQPGIDPNRVVMMGHSAGAHLAALIASDPQYLEAAGVPLTAIKGAVLLDGAGYDVPRQMGEKSNLVPSMYVAAFGADPKRQSELSPINHAEAPNVANWLILPVAARPDSSAQSEAFAARLKAAGAQVEVKPQTDKNHMTLNKELGEDGDPATADVDAFLATLR